MREGKRERGLGGGRESGVGDIGVGTKWVAHRDARECLVLHVELPDTPLTWTLAGDC